MRNFFIFLFFITPFIADSQSNFSALAGMLSPYDSSNRPEVMVIGTFHYNEYKGDDSGNEFTGNPPDMMSQRRQTELDSLARALMIFKPTKICIEVKTWNQADINAEYKIYLKEGSNERNEYIQLGFRLGKMANHNKVYAVDVNNHWYMDSMMQYAVANEQGNSLMEVSGIIPTIIQDHYEGMENMHISNVYARMNSSEELLAAHALHQSFTSIGKGDNYIGTNLFHDWMERNHKIYTNISRLAEANDRIIVIYGASHAHSLKNLFDDSYDFDLIEYADIITRN